MNKLFVIYDIEGYYVSECTQHSISCGKFKSAYKGDSVDISNVLDTIAKFHGDAWQYQKKNYVVMPLLENGQVDYSVLSDNECDDMEGERNYMRAVSEYRELTEDERYIYSL